MTDRPIADYALLSDCQGAALVARDGSIDWACLPRFDAPAVFARLLGDEAGHWRIGPAGDAGDGGGPGEAGVRRAYLAGTMVLETTFTTATGTVAVTDALVFAEDERGHRIGHRSPHVLVRRVTGLVGEVAMALELAPRPDYGLTRPVMVPCEGGLVTRGGPQTYVLTSEVALDLAGTTAAARFPVAAGQTLHFGFGLCSPWEPPPTPRPATELARLLDGTVEGWRSWSALHQNYRGPYQDLVSHSGRVLQALTYAPSGAVVAAPTTSLPETIGGSRNWDYRFCWVRDASLTLGALWVAACPDEASLFFDFFATAAGGHLPAGADLQILWGVGGERLVPEHELAHLPGYRGSAPVLVGNGAWNQVQLDVYGELLDAAWLLAQQVGTFDPVTARFLVDVADAAAARWTEPDQGIWEVRGDPRHFTYSKLMCWVALDRAVRLADALGAADRAAGWRRTSDEIRTAIEGRAWSDGAGAFTQAFGSDDLDASALMLLLTGFLPASDARMRATVDAVADRLTDDRGFVFRYRSPDGLPGDEGTFAICTFWLAQCLAERGEPERARALVDGVVAHANDVGLLAEEIGGDGELLGNFPQAFTHVGLVNAAWAIARAEGAVDADAGPPAAER